MMHVDKYSYLHVLVSVIFAIYIKPVYETGSEFSAG